MLLWKKKPAITRQDGWLKVGYQDTDVSVRLFGRLDRTLRDTIRGTLQSLLKLRGQGAIHLQMMDVFLLDPSTAAGLVAFFRDAEQDDVRVEVRSASPAVKQVFKGLGVSDLLDNVNSI
ncbi:hypothetical protein F4X88_02370 [Candidatus Poribacteria bacterium]|nr:hypothetical protein [Candidatus Poribacteria bacterium]MYA55116.1 hypothetical protein [Candidatus Poribacteria bacterium]